MSTCSICVEDARNPVCCVPCGHVYCRICIDKWQKRSKNNESECPECREKIQDVLSIYIRKDDSKGNMYGRVSNWVLCRYLCLAMLVYIGFVFLIYIVI